MARPPGRVIAHVGPFLVGYPAVAAAGRLTAAAAVLITSATASGWEIMNTCEPSTSVMVAPARSACERITSVPAALSPVATTAQEGRDLQAGGPDGSVKASSATGRWVAAATTVCSGGTSAANASRNFAGSIANSVAVPPPFGGGERRATC